LSLSELYLHFDVPDAEGDTVTVQVQTSDIRVLQEIRWTTNVGTVDFLVNLGRSLRDMPYWEGDDRYDVGMIVARLADALLTGLQWLSHARHELLPVFEIVDDDWGVTIDCIVEIKHRYAVVYSRFNEGDWDRHMRSKNWVKLANFRHAFDVGYALIERGFVEGKLRQDVVE
jgi:hypothetical protein